MPSRPFRQYVDFILYNIFRCQSLSCSIRSVKVRDKGVNDDGEDFW